MLVLALDTALKTGGCALASGGELLGEAMLDGAVTHSRQLMGAVDALLKSHGLQKDAIQGLGVNLGPGYFTGLRIGVATAQGLALGLGIPAWGESCLALLAGGLSDAQGVIWAVADARRGLVYAAPFKATESGLKRLGQDACMAPARLAGLIRPPAVLVGDGAALYAQELLAPQVELAPPERAQTRPGVLALRAARGLAKGEGLGPGEILPSYVRPSDAEVNFGLPLDSYCLLDGI